MGQMQLCSEKLAMADIFCPEPACSAVRRPAPKRFSICRSDEISLS
jgi:hypothetical protein